MLFWGGRLESWSSGYECCCSSTGPRVSSQHPHGGTQVCATPAPADPTPSHRHPCRQNTNEQKIKMIYQKNMKDKCMRIEVLFKIS